MDDAAMWATAAAIATRALESTAGELGRAAWTRLARLLRLHEPEDHGVTVAVEKAWSGEVTGASVEQLRSRLADRVAADPDFAAALESWWAEAGSVVVPHLPPIAEIKAEVHSGGTVNTLIQVNQVTGGISITSPSSGHDRT